MVLLHLPFLHADPDINLTKSRDAFTDEGLNTSQLRNYVNHHYLDFMECDNLVKTPLFNATLYIPLKIFGTKLIIARLVVLITFIISIYFASINFNSIFFTPLLLAITLLQYYVFQYTHFSLSEMMSVGFILLGTSFLYRFITEDSSNHWKLFLASIFISLAYYCKIQYLYMAAFIPLVLILVPVFQKNNTIRRKVFHLIYAVGWVLFFLCIYYFMWYEPHKAAFNYVLHNQAMDKFAPFTAIPRTVAFNIFYVLFSNQDFLFNSIALLCFLTGSIVFLRTNDLKFKAAFILCLVWVLLELQKLSMPYLPSRYLVSYYFATGLLCTIVLRKMISTTEEKIYFFPVKTLGIIFISVFTLKNALDYYTLLNRRTYKIAIINDYFSKTIINPHALVLGPWSPSLNWDSRAICKPVWKNFMNDKNILEQHPRIIISEPDEAESNQAYSSQNINLNDHADSVRKFNVGNWNINIFWISEPPSD
jgi:hypothetical protein